VGSVWNPLASITKDLVFGERAAWVASAPKVRPH
jgi:hypothetical protein